jgi:glycosyltransferase involved in cell wall biosynthesis
MKSESIGIILPTRNEELNVGRVIQEIPRQYLEELGYKVDIVVVDGVSTDRTTEIAQENGASIIVVQSGRGKGHQLRTALKQVNSDYIFILDADYTYPAGHIPHMLQILNQGYHVVTGSRLKGQREKGAISMPNMVGNILLTFMANVLYQVKITDVCTGFWGIRGDVIRSLNLSANGFEFEADLFARLSKNGYRIAEIPIYYRRREDKSKLKLIKDGLKIGWTLVSRRFFR